MDRKGHVSLVARWPRENDEPLALKPGEIADSGLAAERERDHPWLCFRVWRLGEERLDRDSDDEGLSVDVWGTQTDEQFIPERCDPLDIQAMMLFIERLSEEFADLGRGAQKVGKPVGPFDLARLSFIVERDADKKEGGWAEFRVLAAAPMRSDGEKCPAADGDAFSV